MSGRSIIVIGGLVNGTSSTRVDAYDLESKTWKQLSSLPANRFWHGATTINGKIYVSGGVFSKTVDGAPSDWPTQSLFVYDPVNDSWSRKANLPTKIQMPHQAALKGKLYVYEVNDHFWVYTPRLDSWAALPLPPFQRLGGALTSVGDKLYLTGGFRYVEREPWWEPTTEVHVYHPASRGWSAVSPIPAAHDFSVTAALHDKLWVVGGSIDDQATDEVYVYDPAADRWAAGPPLLRPTSDAAGAVAGGKVFVIGGVHSAAQYGTGSTFVEALNTPY